MRLSKFQLYILIVATFAIALGIGMLLASAKDTQATPPPGGSPRDPRPGAGKFRQRSPMATPHREPLDADFRERDGVDKATG